MTHTKPMPTSRQQFLEHQPTYWLKRCYGALRRRVDAELRPYGLTLAQREALLLLREAGPLAQSTVAAQLGIEQSSASRLIRGLRDRGMVEIGQNPEDGRSQIANLSAHGRSLLGSTPGASRVGGALLSTVLSTEEIDELVMLLRQCTEALENATPEPAMRPSDAVPRGRPE